MPNLVFSYAHADEEFRDELERHLSALKRVGVIETWHDRKILAGQEFSGVIDGEFAKADIILLLVSPDFIASDYCFNIEMRQALDREQRGETVVIPVILRPCHWTDLPFGKLQSATKNGKPIVHFPTHDDGFYEVTTSIRRVVEDLQRNDGSLNGSSNGEQVTPPPKSSKLNLDRTKARPPNNGKILPKNRRNSSLSDKPPTDHPTLIDALIILFVAAALSLFLLWLATRIGNLPVLETLPGYVSGAFSSIWSSALATTIGIGLAVFRALTAKSTYRPNYLGWILATTVLFAGGVLAIAWIFTRQPIVSRLTLPGDSIALAINKGSGRLAEVDEQPLYIASLVTSPIGYRLTGRYSIKADRLEGKIERGELKLDRSAMPGGAPAFKKITGVSISACYKILDGNRESYQIFPSPYTASNFIATNLSTEQSDKISLPSMEFRIRIPPELKSDRIWICAQVWNEVGGYLPSYQIEKPLNS